MKQNTYTYIFLTLCFMGMCACSGDNNQPQVNKHFTMDTPFAEANAIYYGPFYQDLGITSHVFEMEFYTEGLTIDSLGNLTGTGYHLYITDLFAQTTDSIPPQGTYTIDSINYGQPFTIMPGKKFTAELAVGAQLTHVGSEFISTYLLDTGTLTLQWQGDTAHVKLDMLTTSQDKLQTEFYGALPVYYIEYNTEKYANSKMQRKKYAKKHVL